MSTKKEIIISIHLRKTGGSTFRSILEKVYGERYVHIVHTHNLNGVWETIKGLDFNKIDIIHGHFPYGLHRFFPKNIICKYITFVRNPVERLMSEYNYIRHYQETIYPYNTKPLIDPNDIGSTTEFLQWAATMDDVGKDNGMTRALAEDRESFFCQPSYYVTERIYRSALDNLSDLYFIGIQENFENDLLALSKKLGWSSIPEQSRINSFPNRLKAVDLLPMDRSKIEGMQLYDMNLLEEAKKLNTVMIQES